MSTLVRGLATLLLVLAGPAVASAGWYLMEPPECASVVCAYRSATGLDEQTARARVKLGGLKTTSFDPNRYADYPDEQASFSRWQMVEPFDSVELCKRARDDGIKKLGEWSPTPDSGEYHEWLRKTAFTHRRRCVATDDPRLVPR